MAKMIKCPTCATPIEVPPPAPGQATAGQILKCPGCGKQLKIVAKRPPPGQPAGKTPGAAPSPNGSLAGGSLAGASVSSMTYLGDPPPLESSCAVCGKAVDPDELVEDNGKLLCRDCIKGARSKIDRPDVAPDLLDFKRPAAVVRRTKLIHITPSLIVAVLAAGVFIACQVYLTLMPGLDSGKGRAIASIVTPPTESKPAPLAVETTQPTTERSTDAQATPTTQAAAVTDTAVTANNPATQNAALPSPAATEPASPPAVAASQPFILNPNVVLENPATQPVAAAPDATNPSVALAANTGAVPAPAIVSTSTDPLMQGIAKLQNHDYAAARNLLQAARTKYVAGHLTDHLTPEQQMTLVGLAAACIGQGKYAEAKSPLDLVLGNGTIPARGTKSRSAVLNNAMMLIKHTGSPHDMSQGVDLLKDYLSSNKGDDFAANIFGTLLDRVSTMPNVKADQLQQYVSFLDSYEDDLARDKHPDQLLWGIEWKDKNLVQQYRLARGRPANAPPPADLQKELEAAEAKVAALQQALNTAKASNGDVVGAQNQLNAAYADEGRIQTQMKQVAGPAPKPKWLDKFDPEVPEENLPAH